MTARVPSSAPIQPILAAFNKDRKQRQWLEEAS